MSVLAMDRGIWMSTCWCPLHSEWLCLLLRLLLLLSSFSGSMFSTRCFRCSNNLVFIWRNSLLMMEHLLLIILFSKMQNISTTLVKTFISCRLLLINIIHLILLVLTTTISSTRHGHWCFIWNYHLTTYSIMPDYWSSTRF